jgi:hypothetical protein
MGNILDGLCYLIQLEALLQLDCPRLGTDPDYRRKIDSNCIHFSRLVFAYRELAGMGLV